MPDLKGVLSQNLGVGAGLIVYLGDSHKKQKTATQFGRSRNGHTCVEYITYNLCSFIPVGKRKFKWSAEDYSL